MALEPVGLTNAMQEALATEWRRAKGSDLPAAGLEDRRLMFAAVARGLLSYLEAHESEAITSIDFDDGDGGSTRRSVNRVNLDISG